MSNAAISPGSEAEVAVQIGNGVTLTLPQTLHDALLNGSLSQADLTRLQTLLQQTGLFGERPEKPRVTGLEDKRKLVEVKGSVAKIPINVEFRVKRFKLEKRTVYKELVLKVMVPKKDVEKWTALIACIAGSSALTIWLAGVAFGPVGWVTIAAAIIASAIVCFNAISPETFRSADGEGEVVETKSDWHSV